MACAHFEKSAKCLLFRHLNLQSNNDLLTVIFFKTILFYSFYFKKIVPGLRKSITLFSRVGALRSGGDRFWRSADEGRGGENAGGAAFHTRSRAGWLAAAFRSARGKARPTCVCNKGGSASSQRKSGVSPIL